MERLVNGIKILDDYSIQFPCGAVYTSPNKIMEALEHPTGVVIRIDVEPWPKEKEAIIRNVIKLSMKGIEEWRLDPPVKNERDSFGRITNNDNDTFKVIDYCGFCLIVNFIDGVILEKKWSIAY